MNHYETLNVSRDATQEDIREAYQKLVKEKHPDHSDNPNAAQEFMQIQEAYEILKDPERRQQYDELGHTGFAEAADQGAWGKSNADTGAPNYTTDDGEKVGWQSYTRGSDEADYIWNRETDRTASKAPAAHTSGKSSIKRAIAYSLVTGPVLIMGLILSLDMLLIILSGYSVLGQGLLSEIGLMIAFLLAGVISVILAERILSTERQLFEFVTGKNEGLTTGT